MDVAERIKAARKNAGLTQAQLAEKSGVAAISIHQYEAGKRNPQLEQLLHLAVALGVSLEDLTGIPDGLRAAGIDRAQITPSDLAPSEFNEFERFIETMGYYTRLEGDNYRLHKGKNSVVITPDQLKGLVRASRATVAALAQDLMETAAPFQKPSEGPPEGGD